MPSPFIDPTARHPYVLISDREKPADQQHRFFFKVMTVMENAEYADGIKWAKTDKGDLIPTNYQQYKTDLLRFTLVGWEGPGVPPFKTDASGRPTSETIARLHWEVVQNELLAAADAINMLEDDAPKG